MCTLTRQSNTDTAFLAKPSLNEEHTLMVSLKHMHTFMITVVVPKEASPPQPAVLSSADVGRLIVAPTSSSALIDRHAQLYITDATEKERKMLLRQAILRGRGASHEATASMLSSQRTKGQTRRPQSGGDVFEVAFTPPPPVGDGTPESPPMKRVHVFGTVESILGIHRDSLFFRLGLLSIRLATGPVASILHLSSPPSWRLVAGFSMQTTTTTQCTPLMCRLSCTS